MKHDCLEMRCKYFQGIHSNHQTYPIAVLALEAVRLRLLFRDRTRGSRCAFRSAQIQLRLTARRTGELRVAGAICRLAAEPAAVGESLGGATVLGKLVLDPQGPRLNGTKQERTTRCYAVDRRLDLRVVAHMPELQVTTRS